MKTLSNLLSAETFHEVAQNIRDLFTLKTLNNDLFGYAYNKDGYRWTEDRLESVALRRIGFNVGVCSSHPFDPAKMTRLRDAASTHESVRIEAVHQLQVMDDHLGIRHFSDQAQRDALRENMLTTCVKRLEKDIHATPTMWSLNTDDVSERTDLFLKCSVKHAYNMQATQSRHTLAA